MRCGRAAGGDESTPHFEQSLQLARDQRAEFEVALTLYAMADVRFGDADRLRAEADSMFERLGVVSLATVLLR